MYAKARGQQTQLPWLPPRHSRQGFPAAPQRPNPGGSLRPGTVAPVQKSWTDVQKEIYPPCLAGSQRNGLVPHPEPVPLTSAHEHRPFA